MNPRVCNFQKTDSSPPCFGGAVNQGFVAAKRLYIIAQGFSPGFFGKTFDLKASTDRVASATVAPTILDAFWDWMLIEPAQIGRPFRALALKTIPRVEALGYDV
jgi:hypothetical protein